MPATNSTHRFHSWSHTGGLGVPQPDNREETQLHGDTEACMAVLNNYYGDGGWTQSHLICGHLQNDHFISHCHPGPDLDWQITRIIPVLVASVATKLQLGHFGWHPAAAIVSRISEIIHE